MVSYLILCRSLTYAQRTARALEHAGIRCTVVRAPRLISDEGCGYCVKVPHRWFASATTELKKNGLADGKIFVERADHTFEEVSYDLP